MGFSRPREKDEGGGRGEGLFIVLFVSYGMGEGRVGRLSFLRGKDSERREREGIIHVRNLFHFVSFREKDDRREGRREDWNVNGVKVFYFIFSSFPILLRTRVV